MRFQRLRSYDNWEAAMRAQNARIGVPGSPAEHHKPAHGGYPGPDPEVDPQVDRECKRVVRVAESILRDAASR